MVRIIYIILILLSIKVFALNPKIDQNTVKFKEMLRLIDENYVDTVDLDKLSELTFKHMLQLLDKQSYYFTKDEYLKIKNQTSGKSAVGVGINFDLINDSIVVTEIVKNSPADSSELKVGDILIFADGKSLIGVSESEAKQLIKGDLNTEANIIYRSYPNRELKEINIFRTKTSVSVVKTSFMLANSDIGYLKLRTFSGRTSKDMADSIRVLKSNGLKKLLIDLRGNSGGVLSEGVNSAGLFLKDKPVITKTQSKNPVFDKKMTPQLDSEFDDITIIVMIDENSASASEIFAGAIQDYDRGLVVGEISFGKGTVQKAWEFKDTSAFRVTISRWVTPSGRPVELKEKNSLGSDLSESLNGNLQGSLESAINKYGIGKKEIYETSKGRKIVALNGIFPDVIAKADTLTLLTKVMGNKNIFMDHALLWVADKSDSIRKEFVNHEKFYEGYKISQECLDLLAKVLQRYNTFNQKMYDKDKFQIINLVKANIAYIIWGEKAYNYIKIQLDNQVIKAIQNIDKASEMVRS